MGKRIEHVERQVGEGPWKWTEFGYGMVSTNESEEAVVSEREQALEAALRRLLLEFDFMVERGVVPDVRDDIIFVQAREALQKANPST